MLINGKYASSVSVFDRGFQYGDGLFETIAVCASKPRLWSRHIERLKKGAERLGIVLPDTSLLLQESLQQIEELNSPASAECAVLKIIITRGESQRGYAPPANAKPTRCILISPCPDFPPNHYSSGIQLAFCQTPIAISPHLAGIKHLNRLEQVLGRAELNDRDVAEGLMSDAQGNVIEGTMSNLFMLKDDVLFTPDLAHSGVAGIMRQLVMEVGRELGMEVRETSIQKQELITAQALFMTNSVIGIWPVARLENISYDASLIDTKLITTVRQRAFVTNESLELSC